MTTIEFLVFFAFSVLITFVLHQHNRAIHLHNRAIRKLEREVKELQEAEG